MLCEVQRFRATAAALAVWACACAGNGPTANVSSQQMAGTAARPDVSVVGAAAGVVSTQAQAGSSAARTDAGPASAGSLAAPSSAGVAGTVTVSPSAGAPGGMASAGAGGNSMPAAGAPAATMDEPTRVDPSAPLTAIAFFPSKERSNACADAAVSIQFNRTPILKAGGKIQIVETSGEVFDSVTSKPSDLYHSDLVDRTAGAKSFKSDALDVVFNSVVFQPKGKLAYGKSYYITVDEGMITDEMGTPFSITRAQNWTFTVRSQAPAAASSYMLAADGGGDYCSVDGVLAALGNGASGPRMVRVGPGVYPGVVRMSDSQVHFAGAGMDRSIFSHKNSATMNASSREGIVVTGSDVTFEDLTIFNTYPKDSNGQQAEALYVAEGSQRVVLKNVHLRSHQDTLRVDGSAYMQGGKISGSTDPLWGYGAFYCDGCELASRTSGHAFVVARSTRGFGLVNCSVTRESSSVSSTYLAQFHDGSEPGKIAFVKCKMDSHVAGWKRVQSGWYEYQNTKLQSGEPAVFDGKQLSAGSPELEALSSPKAWLGWSP